MIELNKDKNVNITINTNNDAFNKCWPLNVIGAPDIIPWSFKKAITEPEKVIAPTAAPIAISIRLASFIFPGVPRLNADGFINAETQLVLPLNRLNCENLQLILALQSLVFDML